jgi:hypothetical protein
MKPSDGLATIGSYGSTGLKVRPGVVDFEAGVVAGQDLPEAWWNYLWNILTTNSDQSKDSLTSLITELSTVLASSGLSPSALDNTQLDAALKIKYLSRIGVVVTDFNAIDTAALPLGSVTAFTAGTGYTNGPTGATVQAGLIVRPNIVSDSAIVIAFGNASTLSVTYPCSFRVKSAGAWLAWASLVGSNNGSASIVASTFVLRDGSGRAKVAAPSAEDDVARKAEVTAEAAARVAADNVLQSNINTEASTRGTADTTLQTNINTEAGTRATNDGTLQTNINNEASARGTQDGILQTNINNEAGTRDANDFVLMQAGETVMQNLGSYNAPDTAGNFVLWSTSYAASRAGTIRIRFSCPSFVPGVNTPNGSESQVQIRRSDGTVLLTQNMAVDSAYVFDVTAVKGQTFQVYTRVISFRYFSVVDVTFRRADLLI